MLTNSPQQAPSAVTDHHPLGIWMPMRLFGRIFHISETRSQPCAVGRTIISPTSTLAGCSIANAMARAIAAAGIAKLSIEAVIWARTLGLFTDSAKFVWTKPGETIV